MLPFRARPCLATTLDGTAGVLLCPPGHPIHETVQTLSPRLSVDRAALCTMSLHVGLPSVRAPW